MKLRIQIISLFLVVFSTTILGSNKKSNTEKVATSEITICTSPQLFDLTNALTKEYQQSHSDFKFIVNKTGTSDELIPNTYDFYMFDDGDLQRVDNQISNYTVVGRNVIVPVVSDKNPYLNELCQSGISTRKLKSVVLNSSYWSDLLGNLPKDPVHIYITDDPAVTSILFVKQDKMDASANWNRSISTWNDVIQKVQNDPLAIGFCRLSEITQSESGELLSGVKVLPIDKNGNGKLDYIENIYENMQSFSRGIWLGKYPREFVSSVYIISSEKQINESAMAFLKWVLTDGQQEIADKGLCTLNYNEQLARLSQFDRLTELTAIPEEKTRTWTSVFILLLVVIVVGAVCIDLVFRAFIRDNRKEHTMIEPVQALSEDVIKVPGGLYFDKSHSWAFMRKNGQIRVGIDDFLQHVTGKITKVEMRDPGFKIKKGDRLCSIIRKGKVLNVYSPVTGTILEVNEKLKSNSALINVDPYSEGWIYIIEPVNWELELQYLQIADRFKSNLRNEFQRLREFLGFALKPSHPDFAYAVLHDGGLLIDYPLAELGPDIWDDFQTKFIDG